MIFIIQSAFTLGWAFLNCDSAGL